VGHASPRASDPGFLWPAVPPPREAQMLAILWQLERTQWWDPERLGAYQLLQLSALLRHAARTAPAQARRLAGFRDLAPGALTAEAFAAIPPMGREAAQAAGEGLRSTAPPAAHGQVGFGSTSGSSGRPMALARSELDVLTGEALLQRANQWFGRDMAWTQAYVGPAGARGEGRRDAWSRALPLGAAHVVDVRRPADEVLARLDAIRPQLLAIWPSLLAELIRLRPVPPEGLREVATYGETVPPGLRALCRERWGVPLRDGYSAEEVGPIAHECPHGRWHVHAEHVLVEVLDAAGRPCAPGETGRVVLSGLHSHAMPMIRMETGDLATPAAPCPCGRGLPALARIDGRVRDLVELADGRRVLPTFDEAALSAAAPGLRRYQLVRLRPGAVEARVVVAAPLAPQERRALAAAFAAGIEPGGASGDSGGGASSGHAPGGASGVPPGGASGLPAGSLAGVTVEVREAAGLETAASGKRLATLG